MCVGVTNWGVRILSVRTLFCTSIKTIWCLNLTDSIRDVAGTVSWNQRGLKLEFSSTLNVMNCTGSTVPCITGSCKYSFHYICKESLCSPFDWMWLVLHNILKNLPCEVQLNHQTSNLAVTLTQKCHLLRVKRTNAFILSSSSPCFELMIQTSSCVLFSLYWTHIGIHFDLFEGVMLEGGFKVDDGWPILYCMDGTPSNLIYWCVTQISMTVRLKEIIIWSAT